jgi:hypothetical protein
VAGVCFVAPYAKSAQHQKISPFLVPKALDFDSQPFPAKSVPSDANCEYLSTLADRMAGTVVVVADEAEANEGSATAAGKETYSAKVQLKSSL